MPSPYRRSSIERFFSGITRQLHRFFGSLVDWLYSWTLGSSFVRGIHKLGDAVRHKWLVAWDELSLKTTMLIRRKIEPGRKTRWKLVVFFVELRHKVAMFLMRLFAPLNRLLERLRIVADHIGVKISNDPRLRILFAPFRLLYRFAVALIDFIVAWFGTRNYRSLLMGIPAILMFMVLATCLVRIPLHSAHAKAQHYQQAAIEAVNNDQPQAAELYYRKLTQLGVDRPSVTYSEAIMLADAGDIQAAYEKMKSIAPVEPGGYAGAHFWIAKSAYSRQIDVSEDQRLPLIETHLRHTLKQFPSHPLATQLLAKVYREWGRADEGETLIDGLPGRRFTAGDQVRLAHTYLSWGQKEKATELANVAIATFADRFANENRITAKEWILWFIAETILDRPGDAMGIMVDAYANIDEDDLEELNKNAPAMVSHVLDQQWDTGTRELWLNTSEQALKIQPLRDDIQSNLITRAFQDPSLTADVRALVAPYQSSADLSPKSKRMAADLAMAAGDFASARRQYLQILESDPSNRRVLNNLAWLTGNTEPMDLTAALEFANQAVAADESNAASRETRGQLLVKLNRWRAAAEDLEFALNGLPSYIEIHDALATCYDELGQKDLAESHRARLAEQRTASGQR